MELQPLIIPGEHQENKQVNENEPSKEHDRNNGEFFYFLILNS